MCPQGSVHLSKLRRLEVFVRLLVEEVLADGVRRIHRLFLFNTVLCSRQVRSHKRQVSGTYM